MTRENFVCVKGAVCGLVLVMAVAAIAHCKVSKKHRMRRAAFRAMRGITGFISGMRDIF